MLEIEKRYNLNGDIPQDKIKTQYRIEQVYSNLASKTSPDVRIRKIIDIDEKETYFHTVKYILKNNTREELEMSITKEQYNKIFELINKKPVIKDRYLVDLDMGLTAEVDHFISEDEWIVEIEFPNEKAMNDFTTKPSWIGKEIKNKQSYSVYLFSKINNELNSIQKLNYYINS